MIDQDKFNRTVELLMAFGLTREQAESETVVFVQSTRKGSEDQ
jgi:hypothetical protein